MITRLKNLIAQLLVALRIRDRDQGIATVAAP